MSYPNKRPNYYKYNLKKKERNQHKRAKITWNIHWTNTETKVASLGMYVGGLDLTPAAFFLH